MTRRPPVNAPAAEQVARLLALVPYALTRQEVPVAEAAHDLGVTEAQLLKDLNVLMFCGWPGYLPGDYIEVDLDALGVEDPDEVTEEPDETGETGEPEVPEDPPAPVIRVTNAEYLARPLRLTVAEASALIVATRTLRESAPADVVPVVERALAKLEAAAEDGAAAAGQVAVHVDEGARDQAALRTSLSQAIAAGRQVDLDYYVPARDERTTRAVDPLDLVVVQGVDYLDAWCHRADDRRLFRLDRIERADVTARPVEPREVEPRDLSGAPFAALFGAGDDTTTVTLLLEPGARWVAEYYPITDSRERRGGRLEIRLPVADERWLVRLLRRLAPDAQVVAPPELSQEFTAGARATLSLYEGAGVDSTRTNHRSEDK